MRHLREPRHGRIRTNSSDVKAHFVTFWLISAQKPAAARAARPQRVRFHCSKGENVTKSFRLQRPGRDLWLHHLTQFFHPDARKSLRVKALRTRARRGAFFTVCANNNKQTSPKHKQNTLMWNICFVVGPLNASVVDFSCLFSTKISNLHSEEPRSQNPKFKLKNCQFYSEIKNNVSKDLKIKTTFNLCCVQVPGDKNSDNTDGRSKKDKRICVSYECNLFFYFYFFMIKTFFSLFLTSVSDKHGNKNKTTIVSQP